MQHSKMPRVPPLRDVLSCVYIDLCRNAHKLHAHANTRTITDTHMIHIARMEERDMGNIQNLHAVAYAIHMAHVYIERR